nr:MFS transporter [Acinetobacter sp. Marseille-Q1620]
MNQQSWRPFILVSLALCIGTIGTALASPLYPIYQEVWHLLPSHITFIFVAYMFGCLTTLLFLGRTSNTFGYVKVLQAGLFFVIVGLILSAIASNAYVLGVGRFIIGIASGLITTSAMIGLIHTTPDSHKQGAAQLSSIIISIGFGLGPFIGGIIAEFSAHPLVTPYIPIIAGAIISFGALFRLRSPAIQPEKLSLKPHLQLPESQHKQFFYIASFTAFSGFAAFSLFASLSPSFIKDVVPWHGPLVSGISIASILLISAISQFIAKSMPMHKALNIGLLMLISSLIFLALCMVLHWSPLFFISNILVGIGHGFGLLGAFAYIHKVTKLENRAAVVSTYLFIAYLGTIVPIVTVGYLADHFGLDIGVIGFCLGIGALCLYLLISHLKLKDI